MYVLPIGLNQYIGLSFQNLKIDLTAKLQQAQYNVVKNWILNISIKFGSFINKLSVCFDEKLKSETHECVQSITLQRVIDMHRIHTRPDQHTVFYLNVLADSMSGTEAC